MPDMVKKTVKLTKDASGAPATDLSTLGAAHVDLKKRAEKAGISLSKRGLDGIRAQAVMLLDHSGSMHSDYAHGTVQKLVERALGFALQIDVDGTVPVIAFDNRVYPAVEVGVNNYQGVVDRDIWRRGSMGGTEMAPAFELIKKMADETDAPIFLIVIGDGSPADRNATTRVVCELAGYPVFIKFLAIRPVDYLQELDDLPSGTGGGGLFGRRKNGPTRLLDNVDAKFISDPGGVSDLSFSDDMVDEWDSWIKAATDAGVLS
jgi:hypothetical protein